MFKFLPISYSPLHNHFADRPSRVWHLGQWLQADDLAGNRSRNGYFQVFPVSLFLIELYNGFMDVIHVLFHKNSNSKKQDKSLMLFLRYDNNFFETYGINIQNYLSIFGNVKR